ncbi:methylated-DNA--[protein]-cysteine S-methyltransferase [Schnuerera sp. xch1]|uniref:methylated-DNA--[protein]-cysteine S-methyltransferase n=1 Tax=Schnuerera sp. xch1 TaxID=2874283 RepID=UPI002958C8D8|nr:methylated-DNA--[protein]-cysteine S-methyltransferase [Schnuerera sp. xch1]MBZ2174260.1 methylated-DNA--[protein]-cysteine S-methyltransferase [Schnuerera sp. xch1]
MKNVFFYNTVIGRIGIAENGTAITDVFFHETDKPEKSAIRETDLTKKAIAQLTEYLTSKRKKFELPIHIDKGTEFQRKVWGALKRIPYGETRSYRDIAEEIGCPKAYRAVGMANNRNPISIIIPCHRVIGVNGKLVGYGGGIDIKKKLLTLEKSI